VNDVQVQDMTEARENRKKIQNSLLNIYKLPIVSFTLNIPGPEKSNPFFQKILIHGCTALDEIFNNSINVTIHRALFTGSESYYVIDQNPLQIKTRTIEIENNHPSGRIFDMDVFDNKCELLSRKDLNQKPRKCLICNEMAAICSRSRKHSIEELLNKIYQLKA
jgi:holo-ACP synthase